MPISQIPSHSAEPKKSIRTRGFSLVELLVTIAIFALMSTVILVKNSSFNNTVLLNNLAYDMALSIRQAQVYGLSVRETSAGNGFNAGFGMYFDGSDPYSYVFYADRNGNGKYDTPSSDVAVQTYTIGQGNKVLKFCATTTVGVKKCSDTAPNINRLDILFTRPDLDAQIRTNVAADTYQTVEITLASLSGVKKTILVASTGQISVLPGN